MQTPSAITDAPPAVWNEDELAKFKADYSELRGTMNDAYTKYNPTPGKYSAFQLPKSAVQLSSDGDALYLKCAGTGRTGFIPVPPNNYPFYSAEEKYVPVMQADGGQLSGQRHSPRLSFHRCSILLAQRLMCSLPHPNYYLARRMDAHVQSHGRASRGRPKTRI